MVVLVVSAVLMNEDKIVMIQEGKEEIYGKWSIPSGRLEMSEKIVDGAIREVREETGFDIRVTDLTGIYNFTSEFRNQVVIVNFIGEIIGGDIQYDGTEIINAKWLTLDEIENLKDSELRNPQFIRKIIEDVRNEKRLPLEIIQDIL
ncbi:NUDIX domain-containing protein [Wukongibacter baidiensis]|uniref:NUDIX domain-containing protein n=1 Tax=Wukongibacter baidiensis TaxID=1723361 RepID=UPI003D7FC128